MNALIIGTLLGIAFATAGTMYWLRHEIDTKTTALIAVMRGCAEADLMELKNLISRHGNAIRTETTTIHDRIVALAKTDYSEVLTAKNDIAALHAKIDGIAQTTHEAVHSAAAASLLAARRTCAYCNRTVHSFEVESGVVKCTDCKSQAR